MKRIINEFVKIITVLSMIFTMLPMSIASAATEDNTVTYGSLEGITSYSGGHVFNLEPVTGNENYNYLLRVGVYGMEAASQYVSSIIYDTSTINMVASTTGSAYSGATTNLGRYYKVENVTADMNKNGEDGEYVGMALNDSTNGGLFVMDPTFTKVDETHYKLYFEFTLSSRDTSGWNNEATGSSLSDMNNGTGTYAYKFPKGITYLYGIYFKSSGNLNSESIVAALETGGFYGGAGKTVKVNESDSTKRDAVYANMGAYMTGDLESLKPAAPPVDLSFTVTAKNGGAAINGANISLYTDEGCTTPAQLSGTDITAETNESGQATVSVEQSTTYWYKITVPNTTYVEYKDSVTIGTTGPSVTAQLEKQDEVSYKIKATVVNADDPTKNVEGATVYVDNTAASGTTDTSGYLEIAKTNGTYSLTADKTDGSYTKDQTSVQAVINNADAEATVKAVPKRASVTLPAVKDKDGGDVENAKYTVILKSGKADAWGASQVFDAGTAAAVPVGCEFEVVLSSPAEYSADKLYIKSGNTASDTPQIFTDSAMQTEFSGNVEANKIGDPYYNVVIDKGTEEGTYTAKVTLHNLNAMNGVFGLRYDKDVFELETDGFKYNDTELELFETTYTDQAAIQDYKVNSVTQSTDTDTIGYHVFTWQGKTTDTETGIPQPFDATSGKDVATYTFKLKSNKTEEDITSDAFSIMPYDKTAEAKAFIDRYPYGLDAGAREFLDTLFRYTDEANDETSPELGRLEASKAIEGGFYQATENLAVGGDTAGMPVDVMTKIDNKLTANKTVLKFEVVDENGGPVENAKINVTGGNLTDPIELTTDGTGIAKTNVDVTAGDQTYTYIIGCPGYWDMESSKTVTVTKTEPPQTTSVKEVLETKIYHEPKLVSSADGTTPIANAALGGNAYAYGYKNHDFFFSISPDPGYQYTAPSPNEIDVVLKDENGNDKDYKAQFDAAENMYKIPGSEILGKKNDNEINETNPNENGFKSFDIIIKIDPSAITLSYDEKYNIKAMAGTHGKVEYTADTDTSGTVDGTASDSEVKIKEVEPTKNVGKFTFTAVNDGDTVYKVEKVYINGVQVHDYDNLTGFDYTFKNVTADSSIAVTFWDGVTPSTDSVITLVAGDKGTVNITAPTGEAAVRNETKMYLFTENNGAGTLTFEPEADAPDYEFNKAEKSVNGGAKEDLGTQTSYTVNSQAGENVTVYVTFKAQGAEDTFTVAVKSYVERGAGTIAPVGILTYNKNDSPKFTLTATGSDSKATGVSVNGTEVSLGGQYETKEYQLMNLQSDTEIGAIFSETAYILHGIVDLAQGATSGLGDAPKTGATITCVRANDPENMTVIKTSDTLRTGATFTAELAKGTWTITVSKKGYLNYTITDYVVDGTKADMYLGDDDATDAASAKIIPIVPIIGNTSGTGLTVSLADTGMVGSALRPGITPTAKLKADVDNDESVKATSDMVYVKRNYGRRNITETYSEFKTNHAITTP